MWVNPEIPENTRHTRKYPKYPEIPESKKDTRKYPIVFFDTPTRPEPDPLPGILSNTRPDPILKNPTRWALLLIEMHVGKGHFGQNNYTLQKLIVIENDDW